MNQSHSKILLPSAAHTWAREFSSKQADIETGRQVYLNTLCVFAVDDYLQSLGIATDLEGSDSWYPDELTPADSADLELIGIGKIECHPILPNQTEILFPPSARFDRIAYLAVRLEESLESVTIESYLPYKPDRKFNNEIALNANAFESIDKLTDYLGMIRDGIDLFDREDNEVIRQLLEQINERSIPTFVAASKLIYHSNKTDRQKELDTVNFLMKTEFAVSSRNRGEKATTDPELASHNRGEGTTTNPKHKQLAHDWLKMLNTVWSK
jgi:hypothetical protein